MIPLLSSCLSILFAAALVQVPVLAQSLTAAPTTNEKPTPGSTTTEAPSTTTTATATTVIATPSPSTTISPTAVTTTTAAITTTTTAAATTTTVTVSTTTTTISTTTVVSSATTVPTTPPSTVAPTTRTFNPITSQSFTISQSSTQSALPSSGAGASGTSSSSSTNVPAIVGSIVGIAALAIIIATSVICYRRRRHNARELTFDNLQDLTGPSLASKRASHNYLTSGSPAMSGGAIGLNSVTSGGYDDGYDYEMHSNAGYPVHHQQAYSNGVYDNYTDASPHQAYHPSPAIFQEDHHLPMAGQYATASSMSRSRAGFDQNLPEVMYNGALSEDATATGYYNDLDIYNNGAWNQDAQQAGLWVANPEDQYILHDTSTDQHIPGSGTVTHPEQDRDAVLQSALSLDTTLAGSPPLKALTNSNNPQGLPDSPILHSSTLRGGDVFGQDADLRTVSSRAMSPRIAAREAGSSSSPRLASNRDMQSFELTRQSLEGIQSYANEYVGRSSGEGRGSPANLNPNKSLRTLRREDWS
ncbi:hypothetical protein EDD11_004159 [Mortierella claussenii]|nr:hypothetical protein EDD11_004159 [Mortierella claussenii]